MNGMEKKTTVTNEDAVDSIIYHFVNVWNRLCNCLTFAQKLLAFNIAILFDN